MSINTLKSVSFQQLGCVISQDDVWGHVVFENVVEDHVDAGVIHDDDCQGRNCQIDYQF